MWRMLLLLEGNRWPITYLKLVHLCLRHAASCQEEMSNRKSATQRAHVSDTIPSLHIYTFYACATSVKSDQLAKLRHQIRFCTILLFVRNNQKVQLKKKQQQQRRKKIAEPISQHGCVG
jgi:hypothetical protein